MVSLMLRLYTELAEIQINCIGYLNMKLQCRRSENHHVLDYRLEISSVDDINLFLQSISENNNLTAISLKGSDDKSCLVSYTTYTFCHYKPGSLKLNARTICGTLKYMYYFTELVQI